MFVGERAERGEGVGGGMGGREWFEQKLLCKLRRNAKCLKRY